MNLEYLIVGIAKGNARDLREFYDETRVGTFITAFSILGDRQLARDAAVEAYKRAVCLAYKFDTDLSAEYWITDIVRNLCINGMCDGEIASKADTKLRDNSSIITQNALFDSKQDRGKIIAAKLSTKLGFSQVANLLWYRTFSLRGEYRRGIAEAGAKAGGIKFKETERQIKEDFEKITPDYFEFITNDGYETPFKNITEADVSMTEADAANPNETQDARKARVVAEKRRAKQKRTLVLLLVIAVVVVIAAVLLGIYFAKNKKNEITQGEQITIREPLLGASETMLEISGKLYFENRRDDCMLYSYDLNSGKIEKISTATPKDMMKDGERLYFRNSKNGHLSYLDTKNGKITESELLGAIPAVYGDKIVYSSRKGISICDKDLKNADVIFETSAYRERIVCDGTQIYVSTGVSKGLLRLTEENGEFICDKTLDSFEFYDIKLIDGYIAFEDGLGDLIFINVSGNGSETRLTLSEALHSAAFCEDDGYIYYNAKDGIYKVSPGNVSENKRGEKVVALDGREYDVSDIYVSGKNIYCYFSNGEKEKPYNELVKYEAGEKFGEGKTVFKVEK